MECLNCELKQRQFYCENCLKQHLLSLRLQTKHAATDRDAHILSARRALETIVDPARRRRADLKCTEERVQEIWTAVDSLRKKNEKTREGVRALRSTLAARRRTLVLANSMFQQSHSVTHPSTNSLATVSTSPPHGYSPSPPGSYPISTPSVSQSLLARPVVPRRGSSGYSVSSQSSAAATPTTTPRQSRSTLPFTSAISSPSSHTVRSTPTSPQMGRNSLLAPSMSSPHSFAHSRSAQHGAGMDSMVRQIDDATFQLAALADTLARARSGLVQELVEVFSVVEVGGRPPLGGKAGTKGEWTIGGLILPVPGDIRRYPPDHINAVLTHTVHFVTLLAFYLGIKLPFEVVWSRSSTPPSSSSKGTGLLGVGTPWIGAIKAGESGGWARYSSKYALHVSASSQPNGGASSSPSRPSVHSRSASTSAVPGATSLLTRSRSSTLASSMADSQLEEPPSTTSSHGSSFTTALAMLLYNVCYLAHTQVVEIPLAQAGEVLGNLWAVCCSPELGKKSHATRPLLPPPTPPSFPLDFAQLLQATAANPSRPRARGMGGREHRDVEQIIEEDEEGWDLVDASLE
ncbi:uncharacterized protein LAESUDRAFT_742662 [Laetiporus sulphureus 93-53]|uniref:Autophagy-related protein 14 n=1 Tax=Laetiporus sulphureus 93-53 TaxID=1314785 RepID=A0A165EW67_9APHY|nr:uncharacterized protein LAESUDRAFT_742662 [Laetiporus sulphureus 93-53]KZT07897.1 hypothetical protein LAESUDRAFT_742662 [Laetiporus sulphureus 93-53]